MLPLEVVADITQEIFVEAYRCLGDYDSRKPLKNWLAGIALHRCRDHWRSEYRRHEIPLSGLSPHHQQWIEQVCATDGQASFGRIIHQREAKDILDYGLARLPEKNRLLRILIYLEGFSVKEVAQMLNWNQRVMRDIRSLPLQSPDLVAFANPFVWRFATVSCSLAVVLVLYLLGHGPGADQLSLELMFGDPIVSQSLQLLALTSGETL